MASPGALSVIRALIPDTDKVFGDNSDDYMFSDEDLNNYLAAGGNNTLRAAGYAVMAVASSEALISKKIREQDLQTDGPAVSDALMKKAAVLFSQADAQDAASNASQFNIYYWQDTVTPELDEENVATFWGV